MQCPRRHPGAERRISHFDVWTALLYDHCAAENDCAARDGQRTVQERGLMRVTRQNISSGSSWEPRLGYSRAVRVGPHVSVNATSATDADGKNVGVGDIAAQTRRILEIIEHALEEAGASLSDVVRTRVMLVNMADWETVGRIHGEVFGSILPTSLMVEVSRFIDPEWLIEIEADAILEQHGDR